MKVKIMDFTTDIPEIKAITEDDIIGIAALVGINPAIHYDLTVVFKHPKGQQPYGLAKKIGPTKGEVIIHVKPKQITDGSNRVLTNTLVHEIRHIKQYVDEALGHKALTSPEKEKDAWAFARKHVSQGQTRVFGPNKIINYA